MKQKIIAPSILSADFSKLGEEILALTEAGADWIHVDVMDGHFVPNLTIGAPVVKSLKKVTNIPLDVHLMISSPEKYISDFAKAGAHILTFHVEATQDPQKCIDLIKSAGMKVGMSLRPGTKLKIIEPFLNQLDLVLVMTVEPGFGGQSFMTDQVYKISELKKLKEEQGFSYLIEVDGGVNKESLPYLGEADVLVAGSFVFQQNYRSAIICLKSSLGN